MGHQIIKQPDGKLAVFSSGIDAWILVDAEPEDLLGYYAERAAEEARRSAQRTIDAVLAGEPQQVYCQFTMTFEKADADSRESSGPYWADGGWQNFREAS